MSTAKGALTYGAIIRRAEPFGASCAGLYRPISVVKSDTKMESAVEMPDFSVAREAGCRETVVNCLGPAQARWGRLSVSDYGGIDTADDLVDSVVRCYRLTQEQAKLDVDAWLREVGFGAGLLPMFLTR